MASLLKPLSTKETSAAREGQFQRDVSNQKPEKKIKKTEKPKNGNTGKWKTENGITEKRRNRKT